PWASVQAAWDALRPCGHLACFSPNMEQVKETVAERSKPTALEPFEDFAGERQVSGVPERREGRTDTDVTNLHVTLNQLNRIDVDEGPGPNRGHGLLHLLHVGREASKMPARTERIPGRLDGGPRIRD